MGPSPPDELVFITHNEATIALEDDPQSLGQMRIDFGALTDLFGPPQDVDDPNSNICWRLYFPRSKETVVIYNWKTGPAAGVPLPLERLFTWQVAGTGPAAYRRLIDTIRFLSAFPVGARPALNPYRGRGPALQEVASLLSWFSFEQKKGGE